MSLLNKK
jgi:hypothetical protein